MFYETNRVAEYTAKSMDLRRATHGTGKIGLLSKPLLVLNYSVRFYESGKLLGPWQCGVCEPRRGTSLPFLRILLTSASECIETLGNLNVLTIRERTESQGQALMDLWRILGQLPTSGTASCVGISKALLLLTNGRLGPAFDSKVRRQLGIGKPLSVTCAVWIATLEEIAEDIRAFEAAHGSLAKAVPQRFAHLAYGRLYDMALGPR